MARIWIAVVAIFMLTAVSARPISAQEMAIDNAFSDTKISSMGLPEVTIEVGPDGVTAPAELPAGPHLVTLIAVEPYVAYVNFMQPPAGLTDEEATDLALAAASEDLAQPGWVYAGGNNTFEIGVPVKFIIDLKPGEYQIAASYYRLEPGSEEVMRLLPVTVVESTDSKATPAADALASVTLEETDELRYIVTPDPVPGGPQVWKIANTGQLHAHHVIYFRIPDGVTSDDIVAEFGSMMAGTPPAGQPLVAQFTHVGYSALQSGRQTTWIELDLEFGTYAVICFIVDHHTGRPHVMDGMATVFEVR